MPLKVLQIVNSFSRGGAELLARDLALALDPARVRSDVWSVVPEAPEISRSYREPLDRAALESGCLAKPPNRKDPRTVVRLVRLIRRNRYDVVHSHCQSPGFYGRLAATLVPGTRRMLTVHSTLIPAQIRQEWFLRAITDLYVPCSSEVAQDLRRKCRLEERRFRLVLNGVDTGRFGPASQPRELIRDRHGTGAADPVAITVGRLDPLKCQLDLLEALRGDALRGVHLWLVGSTTHDPGYTERLREAAGADGLRGRVRILGEVPDTDLPDLLAAADVFVLPSAHEGLSLSTLEAMAAGVPVVLSDLPTNRDLTGDGRYACTVPARAPRLLGQAVAEVLADPDAARRRAADAAAYVRERFAMERMVQEYTEIYEELAGRR